MSWDMQDGWVSVLADEKSERVGLDEGQKGW